MSELTSTALAAWGVYESNENQREAASERKKARKEREALEADLMSQKRVNQESSDMYNRRQQQLAQSNQGESTVSAGATDEGYKTELGE